MNGGRCVIDLKNGTKSSAPIPRKKTELRSHASGLQPFDVHSIGSIFPLIKNETVINGTIRLMRLGNRRDFITPTDVILLPIQSIVVVTSPIGVQAPPAFAAITVIPAKNILSSLLSENFDRREIMTMVVVRLSRTAERKKMIIDIIHKSLCLLVKLITFVITSKPLCALISSTIVIAPRRKNRIPAFAPRCSTSCSEI